MAETLIVEFDGELLRRGFSLYVIEATTPDGSKLLYVGMTAQQSPLDRLCGNLGNHPTLKRARERLEARGVVHLASCQFRMVAYPLVIDDLDRGQVRALEKKLAEDLKEAGYEVMNAVAAKAPVNAELYEQVREAFAARFPGV